MRCLMFIASLVGAVLGVPPLSNADPVSAADEITIDVLNANGSGCPDGSAVAVASPDGRVVTVTFGNRFWAGAGGGFENVDVRRNCMMLLRARVPAGYTYALGRVTYHGWAHVSTGATVQGRSYHFFAGMSPAPSQAHSLAGPLDDAWQLTDTTDLTGLRFHPCDVPERGLNVNTEVRVATVGPDPAEGSWIGVDAVIFDVADLVLKQCPGS